MWTIEGMVRQAHQLRRQPQTDQRERAEPCSPRAMPSRSREDEAGTSPTWRENLMTREWFDRLTNRGAGKRNEINNNILCST